MLAQNKSECAYIETSMHAQICLLGKFLLHPDYILYNFGLSSFRENTHLSVIFFCLGRNDRNSSNLTVSSALDSLIPGYTREQECAGIANKNVRDSPKGQIL